MESIKPTPNISSLVHTFTKVLRLRASGITPIDGIKKIKTVDSAPKLIHPQPLLVDEDKEKKREEEEKLRRREAMEVLLAMLFASISAIKAAYAQLQIAQSPYDPNCIQSADEVIVSELKTVSNLKHCHLKKRILPSQDSQLSAEIREQENLLKTYEIMEKKLKSQLQLKDSEILFLKEELIDSDKQSKSLEKKMKPKSSSSTESTTTSFDNLHFSGLNPTHFITAHNITLKSIRSFIQLMMEEMATASWDIDAAADSIEPDTVSTKPFNRVLVFESYVCRKMFAGFQELDFSIPTENSSSGSKQSSRKRLCFKSFMNLKSRKAMEILKENPMSEFGRFCKLKYLSVVHPKMEAAFFGDVRQRSLISSGGFPETAFFKVFAEMAKWVWLLHCLGFSFEKEASIFQVRRGCCFSEVFMESAADGYPTADARPRVGFTVVPGFRVGKTVVQCKVYLSPA
ncbi:hypothetical protein MRB53_035919 [Persea americana]|uniref:Uncharacterized protein n=1 Tax=Persea americana TaxID=3435 RepID=A0ACC2K6G0_PERAE|nr:hypothetical protein MRB53_035919 [Persea americana]|eukprot:TRINITY_DN4520_c0_g1_i1.p1 TRINITY_DN4520_c0_g1~~TRINITY_DN4520_c0_g1_i1.p1  ORF type:complete len:457 (-),score=101.69 TRINITY_DN4520_c0_g1_i1:150-1520(-)